MKTILAALGCAALLGGCAVVPADYPYGSAPYGYGSDYGPYYAPGYYGYYDYGPSIGFSYYGGGHSRDHYRFGDRRGWDDHGRFHTSAPGRWHSTSSTPARAAAPHGVTPRAAGPASNRVRPSSALTQRGPSMAPAAPETRPAS